MIRPAETADLAREFSTFCDGLEQGGLIDYARRGRQVAFLLIEAERELEGARSAVTALRERCEAQQEILGRGTYYAAVAEASHAAAASVLAKKEHARMQAENPRPALVGEVVGTRNAGEQQLAGGE